MGFFESKIAPFLRLNCRSRFTKWHCLIDFSNHADAHNEVMNAPHKASLSHELIAGAAAYEAAKAYEDHVQKNGKELAGPF